MVRLFYGKGEGVMELSICLCIGVVLGFSVIFLVSGELSKKTGLPKSSRYILACFLSFGVMGLAVKSITLLLLQAGPVLKEVVDTSRGSGTYTHSGTVSVQGIEYPVLLKSWQTLPLEDLEASNPQLIEFGRKLFFDVRLSSTQTVSCASCHVIGMGGDDGKSVSSGIHGKKGNRNSPSVLNVTFLKKFFWDGRARSLEDQVLGPLTNPVEMGLSSASEVVEIVSSVPEYVKIYEKLFNDRMEFQSIALALAAFERSLITYDAPFDRFVRGDKSALSAKQIRGMMLFDKIGCRQCHRDPYFSVAGMENASPFRSFPVFKGSSYVEKYDLARDKGLNGHGVWRVPSLRNVAQTAPYFHNGGVSSLSEAVKVMATAQLGLKISESAEDDFQIKYDGNHQLMVMQDRALNGAEIEEIVAFLTALSATPPAILNPWMKS